MSALSCSAECEIYFKDNWVDTPLHIDDVAFENDNYEKYIRLNYINDGSDLVGIQCSRDTFGYLQVFCYHKIKKLSLGLSDDIKEFFDNIDLPKDIHSKDGQQYPTQELENGYFVTLVQFRIEKYS